jgi:AcrR family transcriptional regulator
VTVGPLSPPPGWAPPGPVHVPGAHTRSGNAMNRTRAGLLDGAARAFAERGLRRSTMQSIASAAGVAKATLYNHFRTKDEVARALLAAELDRLGALAAALPTEAALAALADEVSGHPVLRRLAEVEPAVLVGLLTAATEQWADLVRRLAAALQGEPDVAETVAHWLVGLVLQPGAAGARRAGAAHLAGVVGRDRPPLGRAAGRTGVGG